MENIQIVKNPRVSRDQAYIQDAVKREIVNIETIIGNASKGCYDQVRHFLALYFAGYTVFISSITTQCKSLMAIHIVCLVSFYLLAAYEYIAHYRLFKRQAVYRKIKETYELMYQNLVLNRPIANDLINSNDLSNSTRHLNSVYSYKFGKVFKHDLKRWFREFYYIIIMISILLSTTAILILMWTGII